MPKSGYVELCEFVQGYCGVEGPVCKPVKIGGVCTAAPRLCYKIVRNRV